VDNAAVMIYDDVACERNSRHVVRIQLLEQATSLNLERTDVKRRHRRVYFFHVIFSTTNTHRSKYVAGDSGGRTGVN
jgi:hypothetical protein